MTAAERRQPLPAVWVDGERMPSEGPHVSARDRGVTLSDGLFETMRVAGGKIFRFEQHLDRLLRGLETLEIAAPPRLRQLVLRAVRETGAEEAGLRLTVTRGVGGAGLPVEPGVPPTILVTLNPLPGFPAEVYERGLAAHVASGRRNEHAPTAGLKTLAYVDAVVALLEARRAGAAEALWLDTEGHCSEASSSNLFVWTGNRLLTPPVSCGALPGITRAAVLELAGRLHLPAGEQAFGVAELRGASEAFLTSSLRGVAPLVRVGDRRIGAGTPGETTRQIRDAYLALIDRECRA